MIYLSSDLHWGHQNVILYCKRPYKDLEEMNIDIVNVINDTVKESDTLYLLGDCALNPKYVELYLPLLNCKDLRLVAGNHDQCFVHPNGKKAQKSANARVRYLAAGFKTITQRETIQLGKYTVELCHFPFAPKVTDEHQDLRYLSCRPKDTGQILLHGHLHAHYRKNGRQIDVGYDGDLRIFSEDDIIALIEDPRDFIETPISEHYKQRKLKEEV